MSSKYPLSKSLLASSLNFSVIAAFCGRGYGVLPLGVV
jgi:hypothetical protein